MKKVKEPYFFTKSRSIPKTIPVEKSLFIVRLQISDLYLSSDYALLQLFFKDFNCRSNNVSMHFENLFTKRLSVTFVTF